MVFSDTTSIKEKTSGKRRPRWTASKMPKSRSPRVFAKTFCKDLRSMSTPSLSGSYLQTSSTAAARTSPRRLEPFGALVAYFVTYSHTAQRFMHGRQSMLPRLSSSSCAS